MSLITFFHSELLYDPIILYPKYLLFDVGNADVVYILCVYCHLKKEL